MATYKKIAETPKFRKFENYTTVRYHHLDQWVYHCGFQSCSYERIVGHQTKEKERVTEQCKEDIVSNASTTYNYYG